jgi:hypothetical protein
MAIPSDAFAPPITANRRGLARLTPSETGGDSTSGPTGGPTPASEGGRAFGPDSPFSIGGNLGVTGQNLAVTGLNMALGLPSLVGLGPALGVPMAVARGAENLGNFAFNPATNALQSGFQSLFGTTPTIDSLNQALGINNFASTNPALASQRAGERGQTLEEASASPAAVGLGFTGPGFSYGGGYVGAAPGSLQGPQGAQFGLDFSNPSVRSGFEANQPVSTAREDSPPSAPPEGPQDTSTSGPAGGGPAGVGSSGVSASEGQYRKGGLVPNLRPGSGDDEPAMLQGGEFVVRAPAVRALGLRRLMQENRAG